jgi:hypothetical protein
MQFTMHFPDWRMRRPVAADLLPERAGQPVKVWAHISLADLLRLDGSSALQQEWMAQVRARWAGHRAAASENGGDTGAWLDGDAADGIACDAAMAPIVTGDVNVNALEDLVRLCVRPARRGLPGAPHQAQGQRRPHVRHGLRAAVLVPPSGRDPPLGLDPGPEPRRDHHRVEQGQDQSAAQPRTPRPAGVTPG